MEGVSVDGAIAEAIAQGKGWSAEERQAYLDSIPDNLPLFAENLDDVDPEVVEAFKNLTYEDETPESLAEHFKEQGNERFKRGRKNSMYFRHAQQFYTEGLRHAQAAMAAAEEASLSPGLVSLTATLLANRAAANLALKNYGSVRADCDESLRLVPGNVKCLFRKAKAEVSLRRFKEAKEACVLGLDLEPGNNDLIKVKEECDRALGLAAKRLAASRREKEARLARVANIWEACTIRGVQLGPAAFEEGHHEQRHLLLPQVDEGGGSAAMSWPVLLLYPQYGQSDAVEAVGGEELLAEVLARVFPEEGPPAPWDKHFQYRCSQLEVYFPLGAAQPFRDLYQFLDYSERLDARRSGATTKTRGASDYDGSDDDISGRGRGATAGARAQQPQPLAPRGWVRVHPGCRLLRALQHEGHVVAGALPTFTVLPRDSSAHADFLREAGRVPPEELGPG